MTHKALQAAMAAEAAGDLETAVAQYSAVLAADPRCVEALNNLGALASRVGQPEDALNFYREALTHRPDFVPSRINLARTLAGLGQIDEADRHYAEVIGQGQLLQAERAEAWLKAGHPTTAQQIAQEACLHSPADAALWLVLGNARLFQHSPEEAERCYRKAQSLADTPRARANLALALLAQSRFAEAWPLYESRYDPALRAPDAVRFDTLPWPQWQGEDLAGKHLLVVGEQGLGDQIHFARFIALAADRGARVELLCHPSLRGLLATAAGVTRAVDRLPEGVHYDYWTPMLSLPFRLGAADGRACPQTPYLSAEPALRAQWRAQLDAWGPGKRKVGLVWTGAAGNAVDRLRSLRLDDVLPLIEGLGQDTLFLSLQTGELPTQTLERQCLAGIIPVGDMLTDFSATAALIAELDMVIAVDTAVAHLAGALNKPVWALLPGTDWRWGRPGSPSCTLYPSVRPFWRDPVTGWDKALQELGAALRNER